MTWVTLGYPWGLASMATSSRMQLPLALVMRVQKHSRPDMSAAPKTRARQIVLAAS